MSAPSRSTVGVFSKIYHVWKRCRHTLAGKLETQCVSYLFYITIHYLYYNCICNSWIYRWLVLAERLFWSTCLTHVSGNSQMLADLGWPWLSSWGVSSLFHVSLSLQQVCSDVFSSCCRVRRALIGTCKCMLRSLLALGLLAAHWSEEVI